VKLAIYTRTSKQEGEDEGSIPVQLAECREHARDEDWEVVAEYSDPGITGWKRKVRPQYELLFGDAEAGRIDAVLTTDDERLLRNDKEGQRWLDLYEARGFHLFKYVDQSAVDLRRAADRKTWKERVASAVYYSERLSEKVRRTKRHQAAAGSYTGGESAPFGYTRPAGEIVVEGKNRRPPLEIDPEEAASLHDAVARLARGETAGRIAREWNAAGRRTSRGARWRPGNLRRALTSNHLTGGRGYPRILSDEEAAIARSALAVEKRPVGRPVGLSAPLAGFLRCGECGSKLTTGAGAYRCSPTHGGCGGVSIKQVPLEHHLLLESLRRWLEIGRPGHDGRDAGEADALPLLEELRKLEARAEEIAEELADPNGTLTPKLAGEASRRVEDRRRELTEQLGRTLPPPRVEPQLRSLTQVFAPDELVAVGLERFVTVRDFDAAEPFRQRREERDPEAVQQVRDLYVEVLDHAIVNKRKHRGRGFDPSRVEIEWRDAS
jgi:DNA invertase Pin-like site-specific DNA recombinase